MELNGKYKQVLVRFPQHAEATFGHRRLFCGEALCRLKRFLTVFSPDPFKDLLSVGVPVPDFKSGFAVDLTNFYRQLDSFFEGVSWRVNLDSRSFRNSI